MILWLKFELIYYNVAVHYIYHYATGTYLEEQSSIEMRSAFLSWWERSIEYHWGKGKWETWVLSTHFF